MTSRFPAEHYAQNHQECLSFGAQTHILPRWPQRSLGTTILPDAVGLKREVASLVGGFDLAIGAFAFNTTRRERGPRGEMVIGHCVRYLGIGENLTAVLTY